MKKSTAQLQEMLKKCNSLNEYIKANETEFLTGKPNELLNEEINPSFARFVFQLLAKVR